LSLAENKEVGILARDSDIRRILGNTLSYLFYSEKSQFNDFLSQIRGNKIEVYFVSSFQQAKLVFDTDSFCPSRKISGGVANNIDSKLNNL
jgi:3D (Asp-Asp-Asp) domain-containing protein